MAAAAASASAPKFKEVIPAFVQEQLHSATLECHYDRCEYYGQGHITKPEKTHYTKPPTYYFNPYIAKPILDAHPEFKAIACIDGLLDAITRYSIETECPGFSASNTHGVWTSEKVCDGICNITIRFRTSDYDLEMCSVWDMTTEISVIIKDVIYEDVDAKGLIKHYYCLTKPLIELMRTTPVGRRIISEITEKI